MDRRIKCKKKNYKPVLNNRLHDIRSGLEFLKLIPKALSIQGEKINKGSFIEIKKNMSCKGSCKTEAETRYRQRNCKLKSVSKIYTATQRLLQLNSKVQT